MQNMPQKVRIREIQAQLGRLSRLLAAGAFDDAPNESLAWLEQVLERLIEIARKANGES